MLRTAFFSSASWLERAFTRPDPAASRGRWLAGRIGVGVLWFGLIVFLVAHHVMWRDEVRAFTLAQCGDSVLAMPACARGYGHPLLWHVLLRLSHAVFATPLVLPGLALAVASIAAALLLFVAPLRLGLIAIVLFGGFGLYEYAVMARNYGIGMLLLFTVAAGYARWRKPGRDRGLVLGILLALLCNANIHCVVLALACLVFWAADVVAEEGVAWSPRKAALLRGAVLFAVGAAISVASVLPSVEDAPSVAPASLSARAIQLLPGMAFARIFGNFHFGPVLHLAAALLVLGSVAQFARRPAALLAAVAALGGLQLVFVLVYPGFYRHEALLIVFDLTLVWLVAAGHGGAWPAHMARWRWLRVAEVGGRVAFVVLLAAQLPVSVRALANAATGRPESTARAVAELLTTRGLGQAIILTDPDFMAEALPYYTGNPLYSLRQGRFAQVVGMKRAESHPVTLGRILATARIVQQRTGRDVVILLNTPLPPPPPIPVRDRPVPDRPVPDRPVTIDRSTIGPLVFLPAEITAFRAATVPLAVLRQATGDERFSVYLLRRPTPDRATP